MYDVQSQYLFTSAYIHKSVISLVIPVSMVTVCVNEDLSQQTQNICTTLAQRLRRQPNIVQMLFKCFVFAGRTRGTFIIQNAIDSKITKISFKYEYKMI